MRQLNIILLGLFAMAIASAGCDSLLSSQPDDDTSESLKKFKATQTQDYSSQAVSPEPVLLEYSFDNLDIYCWWDSEKFPNPYEFFHFEETPRWGICSGTGVQGMDEPVINPMDSRYYRSGTPHTTIAYLDGPVDTLSVTTANFRSNPASSEEFYSALIAYDEEGNEIDIAENTDYFMSSGRRFSKVLTVAGKAGKRIYAVGIATYQNATYIDNLRLVINPSLPQEADETPPEIFYTVDNEIIWPPNHQMVQAVSHITATDDSGDPVELSVEVTSSEPVEGKGDGNTSPDWEVRTLEDGSIDVWARAERSGKGGGRVYTILIRAMDSSENVSESSVEIQVPQNQGK